MNKKYINLLISLINKNLYNATGYLNKNLVRVYWFEAERNFGDLLNMPLLKYYGLSPVKKPINVAETVAIGSVLDNLKETFSGYIIGSGLMNDQQKRFTNARIMAVRGELTRDRIGASKRTQLGDPGLLTPLLFPKRSPKEFVLGLIPHYKDKDDCRLQFIMQRYKKDVIIIDVQRSPQLVVFDIDRCSHILSSSLHGLVVSDALGIPNGWLLLSSQVSGKGFKFVDYASSYNQEIFSHQISGYESLLELTRLTDTHRCNKQDIIFGLNEVFIKFSMEIRDNQR